MEYDPITEHIAAMVAHLGEHPKRAVYMAVKELYRLDTTNNHDTTLSALPQGENGNLQKQKGKRK